MKLGPPCVQVDNWTDCPPKPGCITVNVGDPLQFWSDGLLKSNYHRVRMPKAREPLVRTPLHFWYYSNVICAPVACCSIASNVHMSSQDPLVRTSHQTKILHACTTHSTLSNCQCAL